MEVMCEVCETKLPKYRCPTCRIAYCSLDCWKSHKSTNCQHQDKYNSETDTKERICSTESTSQKILHETEDTVPIEKLQLLEGSEELREVLRNPHVRDMLIAIDSSPDPAAAMKAAMLEPIFVEFADRCLQVVEPLSDTK